MNQIQRYNLLLFSLLITQFITLIAQPISSFSLKSFNTDKNQNFNSNFALLGDAQINNEANFLNFSSGQIVYKKPFNFLDPKTSKPFSFSSQITFSITPGVGDGIVFVIFPSNLQFSKVFDQGYFSLSNNINNKFLLVEYNTRKDANHVGINVGSFVSNVVEYNGDMPLTSWIDYDANLLTLQIRLAESGSNQPSTPLIDYPIDLSKMWGVEDVLIGISSNSNQINSLFSWSFEMRSIQNQKSCFLSVLGGVIFATGCGTLVAFVALFVWVIFFGRHSNVVVLDLAMNPVDFKYEKVDVLVDNDFKRSSVTL
ncbi:L-type lectin-domain containing receptor kinase VIII.1-like [Silene latifolia]|uniref:L-type lectin-domain containing receptor kinase VIII.1-like n=1 Tax=Silene latifolia TaxID=37657 RepID=UPI003D786800